MKLHMYSDYIVRSQIFDPDFRTLSGRYFSTRAGWNFIKHWQSGGDYGQSRHYQGIPETISRTGSISYSTTDYLANDISKAM